MYEVFSCINGIFSAFTYAAHHCVGKINTVDISSTSKVQVNVTGIGDGDILCSLNSTHGEFTAEACKASFSLLLSAKMSDKNVRFYFRNDANSSCSKGSWIDFATHSVYYVRLE